MKQTKATVKINQRRQQLINESCEHININKFKDLKNYRRAVKKSFIKLKNDKKYTFIIRAETKLILKKTKALWVTILYYIKFSVIFVSFLF